MNKYKYTVLCIIGLIFMQSCDKIEDTYKDFAGDGDIRYLGKCTHLNVASGWERLIVSWENSVDPMVDKIKVKWSNELLTDSVMLDKDSTYYSIDHLSEGNYAVSVCSVDKNGKESIASTTYGRPYTADHEVIKSFTRIISKHYFYKNHLITYFVGWQDGIESAVIEYTTANGVTRKQALRESYTTSTRYQSLDWGLIDTEKPVTLYRTGRVPGCEDLIEFEPFVLNHQKSYTSDFKDFIKAKYGENSEAMDANGNIREDWAESLTELELDANLSSLDDLYNFPNLKKLILGKNRYQTEAGAADAERGQYVFYEPVIANNVLANLKKISNITVERYNKHYSTLTQRYVTEMGAPEMPQLNDIDLSHASITIQPQDGDNYDSNPEYLIDGNLKSCWEPNAQTSMTEYTLTLDLGKVTHLKGLRLVQKNFDELDRNKDSAPSSIRIMTAGANGSFSTATNVEDVVIGNSSGETVIVPFVRNGVEARYVRIIVNSVFVNEYYKLTFAELGLY